MDEAYRYTLRLEDTDRFAYTKPPIRLAGLYGEDLEKRLLQDHRDWLTKELARVFSAPRQGRDT